MIITFTVGNLANDFIQLYCGNARYIKELKVQRNDSMVFKMWAKCDGSNNRQTPIRYAFSGEKCLVVTT